MTRTTPEGRIKDRIDRALKGLRRVYRYMPVPTGYGERTLDYLLCVEGIFVGVEAKAPGKELTNYQKDTKTKIEQAGGFVFKVSNEEELTKLIDFCLELGAIRTN